jgi:hypothetical protein
MATPFSFVHVLVLLGFGFIVIGLGLLFGFNKLMRMQRDQINQIKQSDMALQKREKLVLASALANELTDNKFKCEAFITIYTELLRNLRDMDRRALYEDTGDFIHQHAPLSRSIYDQNVEKLYLFGPKLAGDIATVYNAIRSEPQYFSMEQTMPRAGAIRIVEMVLDDAQKTLEPIEPSIAALNVIIRDGAKAA